MSVSTEAEIVALGDREHLLLRPDTLVGSTTREDKVIPVYTATNTVEWKKVSVAPAIQNLYQEILTNALDRQYRDSTVKNISVWVNCDEAGGPGFIRVKNDGFGVPVVLDHERAAWKPTIAFSHFRSGSNFGDDQGPRFTAGRNGYGCKATNVFSATFQVHTADPRTGMQLDQTFTSNMSMVLEPRVWPFKLKKGFTDVKFLLDFPRLGEDVAATRAERMRGDVVDLVKTLTMNATACLNKKVSLTLNGVPIAPAQVNHVKHLASYFAADATQVAYDAVKGAGEDDFHVFEVAAVVPASKCPQDTLAFVNSLECSEGTHVNLAWNRLVAALEHVLKSKYKKGAEFTLSPALVKKHVFLVVKALVDAPHFSSQTKERLSTPVGRLGFDWTPSAAFMRALGEASLVDAIHQDVLDKEYVAARKTMSQQVSASGGTGVKRVVVADKYDAASSLRGGKKTDCYLLVTEGDSARALAVAGLAVVGRERYGIYALKGKPLNVRNASVEAIAKNKEVSTLMQILGLTLGKPVTSTDELTYKKLVIFSDQDPDGAHIGGLLLNFIHALFPSILALDPAYVQRFPTPLVRATHRRSNQVHCFYTKASFDAWVAQQDASAFNIRYFKGLGTSTSALAREYFSQYQEHVVDIVHTPPVDPVMAHMFGSENSQARKELLQLKYDKELYVDYALPSVTMEEFVYREVLPYSNYSNIRNIASVLDGLKPVQRKVLFTMFDKNVVSDVKVAQIVGVIAAHTQYHHGEQSLVETVVGMAQDHVGVSNINYLVPEGQFGSRLDPPSVHSAARYIFTRLDPVTRYLFRHEDDAVLLYVEEEGVRIEPEYYVPVIPTVLVNGTFGIGTGWSTAVPMFSVEQLIDMCEQVARSLQRGEEDTVTTLLSTLCDPAVCAPWYDGFKGTIRYDADRGGFTTTGVVTLVPDASALHVTELPVGTWTHTYVEDVEKHMMVQRGKSPSTKKKGSLANELVLSIDKQWTDSVVNMTLYCVPDKWADVVEAAPGELCKHLNLVTDVRLNNMHLHNRSGALTKYDTVAAIVSDFVTVRVELYGKRKAHMLATLEKERRLLHAKLSFVKALLDARLAVQHLDEAQLQAHGFDMVDGSYDHLLNMPFKALTAERAAKLTREWEETDARVQALSVKTVFDLWLDDLAALRDAYTLFCARKAVRYAPYQGGTAGKGKEGKKRPLSGGKAQSSRAKK
jgi:DNA topoisomerase-2